MAHGAPDDSNVVVQKQLYAMVDAGELAVRLGCVGSVDRLGNVLRAVSFEYGFDVEEVYETGIGASVSLVAEKGVWSGYSLCLETGTGPSNEVQVSWGVVHPEAARHGVEVWVNPNSDIVKLVFVPYINTGTTLDYGLVEIAPATGAIRVSEAVGEWTEVSERATIDQFGEFATPVKIVVDASTKKLVRLRVGSKTIDLSNYNMISYAEVYPRIFRAYVTAYGDGETSGVVYISGVILTQNEP